jgi:hypothetical protein
LQFYATHRVAVDSLLSIERIAGRVWEPACGDGAIVNVMRNAGHSVFASDVVDRGCPRSTVQDFFAATKRTADVIVTNPPFSMAQEFVDAALERAPKVIMLLRLAFLESGTRMQWFKDGPLARVHIASRRLPMMHRDGWEGKKSGSAVAHAWFVWDRSRNGGYCPELRWFDWKEHSVARPKANNDNEQIDLEEAIGDAA